MNGDTPMMTTALPPPGAQRAPGGPRMTPGRIAALTTGTLVAVILIAGTAFSLVANLGQGSFPLSYGIPVSNGQVTANISSGNLTLRQVPGSAARLAGTVRYSLVRPAVTRSVTASGTVLSVDCRVSVGDCGLDGTLDVPARASVSLSSGGGDVVVPGFAGRLTLSTGGGNITGRNLAGPVQLSTGGGGVDVSGAAGDLQLATGGGNISGSGVTAPRVTAQTGGGDITIAFTQPPGNLHISSGGGNVSVILPQGATRYNISTIADGGGTSIANSVPINSSSSDTITVDSGGGDISISQAG
jgi:Putative adhesin